ncbi:MAG: glycerol dehydrogenase [Halanaerobium sp.]|jgi:glycerol dehydrogenase|nr:iron-containing alcohol dehydrogenase [Halanaerobium sp.]PUU86840.1 MAG: glycerol dehydrogenase [Halanaerobium sp.]
MGDYIKELGEKALIIADPIVKELFLADLESGLEELDYEIEFFNGECSKVEIERLKEKAAAKNAEMIIGMGGGKTLDTSKAVAHYSELPVCSYCTYYCSYRCSLQCTICNLYRRGSF